MIPIKQPCFKNGPKAYYDMSTVKWMRNKVKPEEISKSINSLLLRKEDEEGVLIKLIKRYSLMKSKSMNDLLDINNNYSNSSTNKNSKRNRNKLMGYDPALFFQKDSLDKIYKLRNLFSLYDIAQERTLDLDKFNSIFNIDKDSIESQRELKQLFASIQSSSTNKVNKNKQSIHKMSLNDLVTFAFNSECTGKYLTIMKKLKESDDTNRSKYLPHDFEKALLYYHDHSRSMKSLNKMKEEIGKIDKAYNLSVACPNDNDSNSSIGKEHYENSISFYTTSRQLKRVMDLTKKHINCVDKLPLIKQNVNKGNLLKKYNKFVNGNHTNSRNRFSNSNSTIHINNESNTIINDNNDEGKVLKLSHFTCNPNTNANTMSHNQLKHRNKIKGHKSKSMNSTDWSASII